MPKNASNDQGREGQRSGDATSLETIIRQRARGLIDAIVEEELEATLGASPSARVGATRPGLPAREPRADVGDESWPNLVRLLSDP